MTPRRIRLLAAVVLGLVAFAAVLVAQRRQGLVRDEIVYMQHGSKYAQWWIDFVTGKEGTTRTQTITRHFGGKAPTANNREHPPLMKSLYGLSELLFHRTLGLTSQTTGYRLPAAAMFGLLVALVLLFASAEWGLWEGIVAGLLTLLLPRSFFHAGLACFDVPTMTLWFGVAYAYYRALASPWWAIGLAVALGLALATKHNALMLPAVLVPHAVWVAWRTRKWRDARYLWIVVAMVVGAPLVLVAVWPWLWFDTVAHLRDWIGFHLTHVHYHYEYLGKNWNAPPFPWHVPIVTTLLVVPVVTVVAGLLGFGLLVARARAGQLRDRAPALLLFLSAGVALGPFLLRSTPIFGAEKHWATAFPAICIFAGVGVVWAGRTAVETLWGERATARARRAVLGGVAGVVCLAALAETIVAQPYGLSYYNALAGGPSGGADLGMNRQFWGYAARGVLPWLNQQVPGPVYSHDASPAWGMYRQEGLLAKGFPDAGHELAGIRKSQYAIVVHELHFLRHDFLIWKEYGHVQPAYVLTHQGVPIVSVYARGP